LQQGDSVTLTVAAELAYMTGNSVVIVDSTSPLNRFEGTVSSYNYGLGVMVISDIINVKGTFGNNVVYNVNLDGIDGPTGTTGYTGPTGVTGPTGHADRFNTKTIAAITIPASLKEGDSVTLTVASELAYMTGNSVVVVDSTSALNRFEGTVSSYNFGLGVMNITGILNVRGTFGTNVVYNVNLDGIDGPTGTTGTTGVTGPTGHADRFNTKTIAAVALPIGLQEGDSQTLTVAAELAYMTGNSVVVVDSTNPLNRFEGTVSSYNFGLGVLVIGNIMNVGYIWNERCIQC